MTTEKTVTVTPETTTGHFVAHMPLVDATPIMILQRLEFNGVRIQPNREPYP
jgi:fluoroacetyl-CoA thioesterase